MSEPDWKIDMSQGPPIIWSLSLGNYVVFRIDDFQFSKEDAKISTICFDLSFQFFHKKSDQAHVKP